MKKILLTLCSLCICCLPSSTMLHAQSNHDWENPEVIGINKEIPHASLFLLDDKANNPNIISLNGLQTHNLGLKISTNLITTLKIGTIF